MYNLTIIDRRFIYDRFCFVECPNHYTVWEPVCGSDCRVYPHPCTADEVGVCVLAEGECDKVR